MSQTAANQLRSALTLFTAQVSRRLRYTVDSLQYWAVSSVMVSILNSTQIETGTARTRGGTFPRTTKEAVLTDGESEGCVVVEVRSPFSIKPCFRRRMFQDHWLPLVYM